MNLRYRRLRRDGTVVSDPTHRDSQKDAWACLTPLYGTYERLLLRDLKRAGQGPRHIGVILDGNRRWAQAVGATDADGHRAGADKITEVLEWSDESGVEVVTLWMLSTDNLERDPDELGVAARDHRATPSRRSRPTAGGGSSTSAPSTCCPPDGCGAAQRCRDARRRTRGGLHVNVAVGYGGRHEIADAVRAFLLEGVDQGNRSRRWPRTSPWSTSRSTCTPRASRTPTW